MKRTLMILGLVVAMTLGLGSTTEARSRFGFSYSPGYGVSFGYRNGGWNRGWGGYNYGYRPSYTYGGYRPYNSYYRPYYNYNYGYYRPYGYSYYRW